MNILRISLTTSAAAVLMLCAGLARADIAMTSVAFTCEGDTLTFTKSCTESVGGSWSSCPKTAVGDAITACSAGDVSNVPFGSVHTYAITDTDCGVNDAGTQKCHYQGEGTIDAPCSAVSGYERLCLAPGVCTSYDGCAPVPTNLPAAAAEESEGGCSVRSARGSVAAGFGIVLGLAALMLGRRRRSSPR